MKVSLHPYNLLYYGVEVGLGHQSQGGCEGESFVTSYTSFYYRK